MGMTNWRLKTFRITDGKQWGNDMEEGIDRRNQPRVEVSWPIKILSDRGEIEGEVTNISSEGLYVCCDDPLPLNETFPMSILPPDHEVVEVKGKIVRSDFYGLDENETPICIGICFVEVSEEDRLFWENLI